MDDLPEIEKIKRKNILNEVASVYNSQCMSGLEEWAKDYRGDYKEFVDRVVENLITRNSGVNRVYGIDESVIEELLRS